MIELVSFVGLGVPAMIVFLALYVGASACSTRRLCRDRRFIRCRLRDHRAGLRQQPPFTPVPGCSIVSNTIL